jgi:hypothetical protein
LDLISYKTATIQANDVTAASSEDILRLLKLSLLSTFGITKQTNPWALDLLAEEEEEELL